jgi:hypothetical protein
MSGGILTEDSVAINTERPSGSKSGARRAFRVTYIAGHKGAAVELH